MVPQVPLRGGRGTIVLGQKEASGIKEGVPEKGFVGWGKISGRGGGIVSTRVAKKKEYG